MRDNSASIVISRPSLRTLHRTKAKTARFRASLRIQRSKDRTFRSGRDRHRQIGDRRDVQPVSRRDAASANRSGCRLRPRCLIYIVSLSLSVCLSFSSARLARYRQPCWLFACYFSFHLVRSFLVKSLDRGVERRRAVSGSEFIV